MCHAAGRLANGRAVACVRHLVARERNLPLLSPDAGETQMPARSAPAPFDGTVRPATLRNPSPAARQPVPARTTTGVGTFADVNTPSPEDDGSAKLRGNRHASRPKAGSRPLDKLRHVAGRVDVAVEDETAAVAAVLVGQHVPQQMRPLRKFHGERREAGQRPKRGSLRLLPSGPDRVGEALARANLSRSPCSAFNLRAQGRMRRRKLSHSRPEPKAAQAL